MTHNGYWSRRSGYLVLMPGNRNGLTESRPIRAYPKN